MGSTHEAALASKYSDNYSQTSHACASSLDMSNCKWRPHLIGLMVIYTHMDSLEWPSCHD
jgi:hypothetical protein